MKKITPLILFTALIVSAQTTIPYTSELLNYKEDMPDTLNWTNCCYKAIAGRTPSISGTQNIGDFDGDGSDDIYICWNMIYSYHYTEGGVEKVNDNWIRSKYQYCVYSLKKNSNIITSELKYNWPSTVQTGDFNGDQCVDYVMGDKIYTTSTPIKKKAR